jgi:hypothetical protein
VVSQRGEASVEALVATADRALYEAKEGGRNRIIMAKPQMAAHGPSEVRRPQIDS